MAAIIPLHPACGAAPEDWAHFDLVLGVAEDLLPVVSNPRATISAQSAMRDLGKVPSLYNAQRQAVGFTGWTQHRSSTEEIARWSRERDYGICLQTRRVRAIDVDVSDAPLADSIRAFLTEHCGYTPRRSRPNSAKFLVAFEMPGEFTKRKFSCAHGIVEFLATGQQFIACGTHPSGVRYAWDGGELPDAFPLVSADLFESVWRELAKAFAVQDEHTASTSVKAHKLADVIANDAVAQFLLTTNRVKRTERDGRLHLVCPFEQEHTSDSGDSATTYFPAHTGGYANGHFQCLHAHCEHRTDQEFLDAIEYTNADLAAEFTAIQAESAGTAGADPLGGSGPVQGDASHAAARFTFVPAHEFAVGEPPPWMVKGVLPQAVLGVIYGESGSGKTFAALDLAVAVATGSPWRDRAVRQGKVAYIAAEGAGGFRARLKAVAQHRGVALDQIPIGVLADAPNMMEKSDALEVARAIVAAGGAQLVIVDTFAQVMPGANENAGEDVGRALAHCKGIHRATGAMVLLVHHSGKDTSKGARGWSGLRAAADVELEVVRADEARSVTVTKMKDDEDGQEYGFRLEKIVLGLDAEGEEITSMVVLHQDDGVSVQRNLKPRRQLGAVEQIVLCEMDALLELGTGGVEHGVLKAACIAQLEHEAGKRDQRSTRVERALESLLGGGWIERDGVLIKRKEQINAR